MGPDGDGVTGRRVLVTGASGYLGGVVVPRLLRDGWTVTALGNTRPESPFGGAVEYAAANLADPAAAAVLAPWRWDAVVNLAGPVRGGGEPPVPDAPVVEEHRAIVRTLLGAIPAGWEGRLVHASSMGVYGLPERVPVPEDHPRRPFHAYGLAKRAAEDLLLADDAPAGTWVLRLPGLFSAQRRGGALYHFARAARAGGPIRVDAGRPVPWDLLHVDDAAEAFARALRVPPPGRTAVNLGYGEVAEVGEMARRLGEMGGGGARVERDGDAPPLPFCLDVARADALLGGWPPVPLSARLREVWDAWAAEDA